MTKTRLPKKIKDQAHHFWSLRADCINEIRTDYKENYSYWYQGKDTKEASKKHCRETAEKIINYWIRLELEDSFEQEQWLYDVYETLSTEVKGECPFTHQQMMLSLRHNSTVDTKEITAIHNQVTHSGISKEKGGYQNITNEHIVQHLQPLLNEEQEESLRRGLKEMSFEVRAIISAMVTSIPQEQIKERIGEQMLDGIKHLMDNSTPDKRNDFKKLIPFWQAVRVLSVKFNWLWKKEKKKLTKLYYKNTHMVPNEWAKDVLDIRDKLERGKTSFQYYGLLPRYLLKEISYSDFTRDKDEEGRRRFCAKEYYNLLNTFLQHKTKLVNNDGQVEDMEEIVTFTVNAIKDFPYKWNEEEASWIKLTSSELTKYTNFPTPN